MYFQNTKQENSVRGYICNEHHFTFEILSDTRNESAKDSGCSNAFDNGNSYFGIFHSRITEAAPFMLFGTGLRNFKQIADNKQRLIVCFM